MNTEETCRACHGRGDWEVECCSGASGCSCGGEPVYMGTCNVCKGNGVINESSNMRANIEAIQGYCYIGSGNGNPDMPAMNILNQPQQAEHE